MITLQNILERAGGMMELAYRLGVTPSAIYQWPKRGIPVGRWEELETLTGYDLRQFHEFNRRVGRQGSPKTAKR